MMILGFNNFIILINTYSFKLILIFFSFREDAGIIENIAYRIDNFGYVMDKYELWDVFILLLGICITLLLLFTRFAKTLGKDDLWNKIRQKKYYTLLLVFMFAAWAYSILIFNIKKIHNYEIINQPSVNDVVKDTDSLYYIRFYFSNISKLPAKITDVKVYFTLEKESIYLELLDNMKDMEYTKDKNYGEIRILMPPFELLNEDTPRKFILPLNLNYLRKQGFCKIISTHNSANNLTKNSIQIIAYPTSKGVKLEITPIDYKFDNIVIQDYIEFESLNPKFVDNPEPQEKNSISNTIDFISEIKDKPKINTVSDKEVINYNLSNPYLLNLNDNSQVENDTANSLEQYYLSNPDLLKSNTKEQVEKDTMRNQFKMSNPNLLK